MNHQPPPLIAVPLDLSDEAAAKLIDFLLTIAHQMENHYSANSSIATTTQSMSDNPTSGQIPTHRSESSPAPQIAGCRIRCSPFIRAFTQPLTLDPIRRGGDRGEGGEARNMARRRGRALGVAQGQASRGHTEIGTHRSLPARQGAVHHQAQHRQERHAHLPRARRPVLRPYAHQRLER